MSICSHMLRECDSACSKLAPKKNIQEELVWGLSYRNYKEQEKKKPIRPLHSPIDIPFKLCRAELLLNKKSKRKKQLDQSEKNQENSDERASQKSGAPGDKRTPPAKKRKRETEKLSLLDRSVMSQSRYMDYLSRPNPKFYEEPKQKRWKKRCELEPCPPRFVQLAVPNRRRVFANWKDFCDFLPAEMLKRYDDILHTDQNLEPREARYYFKKLDRERRKKRCEKKRLEKKKKLQQEDPKWLKQEIDSLAASILDYLKDEPLFALNYKQMLLADGIIDRLNETSVGKKNENQKKLNRKTKNHYKKTMIEMSDKAAVWIDTLTRFVDAQAIESEIDIPPVSVTSLDEEEGEGESSYEGESGEEGEGGSSEGEDRFDDSHLKEFGEDDMEDIVKDSEDIAKDLFDIQDGEDEGDLHDFIDHLDEDQLDKLIQILSNCSEVFMGDEINAERMPGIKYEDILQKLKDIKAGISPEDSRKKPFLEEVITNWVMRCDPDKVDQKLLNKIRDIAALLEGMLGKPRESADAGTGEEGAGGGLGGAEGAETGPEGAEGGTEGAEGGAEGVEGGTEEGAENTGGENAEEGAEGTGGGTENELLDEQGEHGRGTGDFEFDEVPGADQEGEGGAEGEAGGAEGQGAISGGEEGEGTDLELDLEEPIDLGEEGGVVVTDLDEAGEEGLFIPEEEGEQPPAEGKKPPIGDEAADKGEGLEEGGVPGEAEELYGEGVIKGHKPPVTYEHSPDTVCCLSLKTWAVWLLEITHNAHNWTKWMSGVIHQVREFAATVRGDVKNPDGSVKVLKKSEWRKFCQETEENVVAWRQYSSHVKDLSNSIYDNFHDKKVNCCPKCLQDHLIKNVVTAHETLQALTEAINCAAYWQRTLDGLVERIGHFSDLDTIPELSESESSSTSEAIIEDVIESDDSVFDIEGTELAPQPEENPKETSKKGSIDKGKKKKGGKGKKKK